MGDIHKILASEAGKEFTIEHAGDTFKFRMTRLPWLRVTGIISKCTSYSNKGVATVNLDQYYEEYLIASLVEAPWPLDQTRFILRKLSSEFGDKLEDYVPKPGEAEAEKASFFERKSEQSSMVET